MSNENRSSLSRRDFLSSLAVTAGAGMLASTGCARLPGLLRNAGGKRKNVLFIAVDDLRPELGCYGHPQIKSPNIDALAAQGTLFTHAYCQQAVCNPSRASLLTGLRPDTTNVHDLKTHFRLKCPDAVTLPQNFMNHGYRTVGFSKIFHGGLEDPKSWENFYRSGGPSYTNPETIEWIKQANTANPNKKKSVISERDPETGTILKIGKRGRGIKGMSWEAGDVNDDGYRDGLTAKRAIEAMRELKGEEPFFLGVGFIKPHLPFCAPKKYFDMYPPDSIMAADNPYPPHDCPEIALMNWGELRGYKDINAKGPLSDEKAKELIRAYYACVSYIDTQVGKLLNELDRLGLRDNTTIVLWGDHGWQLGEHGLWCKHTNFEVATRAPLIISDPGQSVRGAKCDALVEFVDIYPTLNELCGVEPRSELEGSSMVPLLERPNRCAWKKAAFSQYPRGSAMGYTMRTSRYRYTEWRGEKEVVARELYDHLLDPDENENIVDQPDKESLVRELSAMLEKGWKPMQR